MSQDGRGISLSELRGRRDRINEIASARGARNVRVFGSVARGESRAGSDIDFLVDMEEGRSALDISELILDLEAALGRPVDVIEIRRSTELGDRVLREAIEL